MHFVYNVALNTQYFLQFAKSHPVVFAEETDIAVLLIYHLKADLKEIFMSTEKSGKTWSISSSTEQIGEVKILLLAIHAWSGSNTTSAIFGTGKLTFWKKTEKPKEIQKLLRKILHPWESKDEIHSVGQKIFIHCYNGRSSDTLSKLRYLICFHYCLNIY